MFAASNNGLSIRAVASDYVAQSGEVLFNMSNMNEITTDMLKNAFSGYATMVKANEITALNSTYTEKYNAMSLQFAKAFLSDGDTVTTTQATLATKYKALMAEYSTKKAAILNG